MTPTSCPICQDPAADVAPTPGGRDTVQVKCPKCGHYEITGTAAASDLSRYGQRYLLSAILRNSFEHGEKPELGTGNLEHLIDATPKFEDPYAKLDLLLKHIHRLSGRLDKWVTFDFQHDYPLIYAEDMQEFHFYLKKAKELDLIEFPTSSGVRLTYAGWQRLKDLSRTGVQADQAFVAMWFDPQLDAAWQTGFRPALEACGFHPMRIDLQEHNEKICDRIVSEIRRSGLVIADFTGQRGGVYFESGFAMGLGIPVIRTCRKDNVDGLHFDTRQYNHVVWETPDELRERLVNRIRATITRPPVST